METTLPRKTDPAFTFSGADVSMFMARAPANDLSTLDTSGNPRIIGDVAQLVNNPVNASTKSRNELYEIRSGDITDELDGQSYMQMSFVEPGTAQGGRDPIRMPFKFDDSRVVILRDPRGTGEKRLAIVGESGMAEAEQGMAPVKFTTLPGCDYLYISDEGKIVAVTGGRETETTWDKLFMVGDVREGFESPGTNVTNVTNVTNMTNMTNVSSPLLKNTWASF